MAEFLIENDPRSLPPQYYRDLFMTFFLAHAEEYISPRLFPTESEPSRGKSDVFIVEIDTMDLIAFDPALGFASLQYPYLFMGLMTEALEEVVRISSSLTSGSSSQSDAKKRSYQIRFVNLPPTEESTKFSVNSIAHGTTSLIQLIGTVVRTSGVRMLEQSKRYQCTKRSCHYEFVVRADPEQDFALPHPTKCPNVTSQPDGRSTRCNSSDFRELPNGKICVNYQEIKVYDKIEHISLGSIPRSITVLLLDSLVDTVYPGDDVVIVGTPLRQWRPIYKNFRCGIDTVLQANHIRVSGYRNGGGNNLSQTSAANGSSIILDSKYNFTDLWQYTPIPPAIPTISSVLQHLLVRDRLIRSICPSLFGMYDLKLALLLTVIGGSESRPTSAGTDGKKRELDSKGREKEARRSKIHMLMVGDPGSGKSQLLRFAGDLVERSVLTTGVGTSGAGLTCTATRDTNSGSGSASLGGGGSSSDWHLEAGALVLAHGGVCCIDEFASMKEHDRVVIHEAMEQQTISVAKAGLLVKLACECSIVAACNMKGRFDITQDLSTNTGIAPPLLSRFDLVQVLIDRPSKDWDRKVSTFLLKRATTTHHQGPNNSNQTSNTNNVDWLRKYIQYIQSRFQPTLSAPAFQLLNKYYSQTRQQSSNDFTSSGGKSGQSSVRLMESLLRIAQAHTRLMQRDVVSVVDAVMAIHLVAKHSNSLSVSLLDTKTNAFGQDDFPDDPIAHYRALESATFRMLGLSPQEQQQMRSYSAGSSSTSSAPTHSQKPPQPTTANLQHLTSISQPPDTAGQRRWSQSVDGDSVTNSQKSNECVVDVQGLDLSHEPSKTLRPETPSTDASTSTATAPNQPLRLPKPSASFLAHLAKRSAVKATNTTVTVASSSELSSITCPNDTAADCNNVESKRDHDIFVKAEPHNGDNSTGFSSDEARQPFQNPLEVVESRVKRSTVALSTAESSSRIHFKSDGNDGANSNRSVGINTASIRSSLDLSSSSSSSSFIAPTMRASSQPQSLPSRPRPRPRLADLLKQSSSSVGSSSLATMETFNAVEDAKDNSQAGSMRSRKKDYDFVVAETLLMDSDVVAPEAGSNDSNTVNDSLADDYRRLADLTNKDTSSCSPQQICSHTSPVHTAAASATAITALTTAMTTSRTKEETNLSDSTSRHAEVPSAALRLSVRFNDRVELHTFHPYPSSSYLSQSPPASPLPTVSSTTTTEQSLGDHVDKKRSALSEIIRTQSKELAQSSPPSSWSSATLRENGVPQVKVENADRDPPPTLSQYHLTAAQSNHQTEHMISATTSDTEDAPHERPQLNQKRSWTQAMESCSPSTGSSDVPRPSLADGMADGLTVSNQEDDRDRHGSQTDETFRCHSRVLSQGEMMFNVRQTHSQMESNTDIDPIPPSFSPSSSFQLPTRPLLSINSGINSDGNNNSNSHSHSKNSSSNRNNLFATSLASFHSFKRARLTAAASSSTSITATATHTSATMDSAQNDAKLFQDSGANIQRQEATTTTLTPPTDSPVQIQTPAQLSSARQVVAQQSQSQTTLFSLLEKQLISCADEDDLL